MPRVVTSLAQRGWNAISRFFHSTYLYLERLTRPVVEQGGQTVSTPSPEVTGLSVSAYVQIAWHYIEGFLNGTYFVLTLLIITLLTLLGKYFTLVLRAVYVFFYYLTQHVNWDGKDIVREWTVFRDLPNIYIDRYYLWAVVCSPSMGLRDYRRWRKRRGLRWARPKVRTHFDVEERDPEAVYQMARRNWATVRRRGGPFLGQANPFDYVSDDEGNWESKDRAGEGRDGKEDVVRTEHVEQRGGDVAGLETGPDDVVKGPSVGRKEARRGAKKRKHKHKR
ncbi:hypothetical protein BR93DRAFT_191829 [Coniochaeta sp. PMI_546]|nr:hypothetical protein BR93DRAFT_191829 [Coniochaeta sp. PMI_546]